MASVLAKLPVIQHKGPPVGMEWRVMPSVRSSMLM